MSKSKSYRKYAATTMAVAVAASAVAPVVAGAEEQGFSDVSKNNDHYDAINAIADKGIISGYTDGTFRPENAIPRANVAVMLTKALNLEVPSNIEEVLSVYDDVNPGDEYAEQIAAVTHAGIFKGNTSKKFNPWNTINREQMATALVKAYDLKDYDTSGKDVDIKLSNVDASHKANVQTLANLGITKALKEFNPSRDVTRGQFSTFLYKSIEVVEDEGVEETLAVESVSAITNKDKTATISGKVTGAEKVEIVLTSFETGQKTTETVNVKNGEYTFKTKVLAPSRYSAEVTAINGDERSETSRADFVIIAADTGFSGFVTDAGGNGINGVTVEVDGKTTTTDREGFYLIEDVSSDQYHDVTFKRAGLVTNVIEDQRVRDGKATVVDAEMTVLDSELITIESSAVDAATGANLENATVQLFAKDSYLDDWFEIADTTVDANGDFDFDQADIDPNNALELGGKYRIVVNHGTVGETDNDPYNELEREFTLATDDVENVLDGFAVNAVKSLDITGKVESNDAPVDAQDVELLAEDGETVLATATTEADGTYAFEDVAGEKLNLPTGNYFLKVEDAEGITTIKAIDVTEGTDVEQNFDLAAQGTNDQFTFKLGAKTPEQLSNGEYKFALYTKDGGLVEESTTVTATDATEIEYLFTENVPAGDYFVRVTSDFAVTTDYAVKITAADITGANKTAAEAIVKGDDVVKGATVEGSVDVENVTGYDDTNVLVQLINKDGEVVDELDNVTTATGAYKFAGVPAGEYTVKAFKYGYIADSGKFTVKVNTNSTPAEIDAGDFTSLDLELEAIPTTGDLEGNVREAGSLKSVGSDVTVTVYNALGNLVNQQTTSSGNYDFSGADALAPGVYTVVLRGDNYKTTVLEEVVVNAGDELTENITIDTNPLAGIELTFVDSNNKELADGTFNVELVDEYADRTSTIATDAGIDNESDNPASFDNLSAGTFTYYFTSDDYQDFSSTITISDKEDYKAVVALTDAGVTYDVVVNAVDEENAPAEDARVVVVDKNNNRVAGPTTLDSDGKATFNLANGDYKVLVYENGYFVGTQEFTVERGNMTLDTIRLAEFR